MAAPSFLSGISLRPVQLPTNTHFTLVGLALGPGNSGLEVLVTTSATAPKLPQVRTLWKERNNARPAPLVVVVLHGNLATLCGPAGDDPPVYPAVEVSLAERLCREALAQPDRHAAIRFLRDALPAVESPLPGVRNEGFLSTHMLLNGAPQLPEWTEAGNRSRPLLQRQNEQLLRGLGFSLEKHNQVATLLRQGEGGQKIGVAVLLQAGEAPEVEADRFTGLSPISYALAVADRENLPYVMLCQGSRLRVYPVGINVGVGRRGRTETFLEFHGGLVRAEQAAHLWLLFSSSALAPNGTLERLLDDSRRFAGDLATRLRERIYQRVIPALARGIVAARNLDRPTALDLAETYQMVMTVLFRLLFIAYAEDKELLPYRRNGLYQRRSLKTRAQELLELVREERPFSDGTSLWTEVDALCRAVAEGNSDWGVPAYGGDLFERDPALSRVGGLLAEITLPGTVLGPVLADLLLIETRDGVLGPVDFRSLGVREFGTIYEGLLENELAVAETDLTVDREGYYRPWTAGQECVVSQGDVYLHNRSGARKATGTYFTKQFAVDHLLDHALEPALIDHLARLDALDEPDAAEQFFDFRVADIAMGSGHFLVAAVDRIERAFSGYLARRAMPGVRRELAELREAAQASLKNLAETVEIEDTQLVRRLIARRCIYGVDLNPLAVTLARLSIWIHTFVPGLPLSLLDHNLVQGNSLVGIGTVGEIEAKVQEDDNLPLFRLNVANLVGQATEPLRRLGRIADATLADVRRARKALEEAHAAVRPAAALCDIVTASRIEETKHPIDWEKWEELKDTLPDSEAHRHTLEVMANLRPFHFPIAFPEVFLRERSGFDVLLGNPPWQEATLEEHAFWARHFPGLRGLSQRLRAERQKQLREERPELVALYQEELAEADAIRTALTRGPYPGMGTGDPDLYKAFAWRYWQLIAHSGGRVGIVLPRSALAAKGSTEFRLGILKPSNELDITLLVNNCQWIFPEVHPQYTIGLVTLARSTGEVGRVRLRGPFNSLARYYQGMTHQAHSFTSEEVCAWTDSASLPLLPTPESIDVFSCLRASPRLDLDAPESWRARPSTELHATNDKALFDLESEQCPEGFWPLMTGESFDLWMPDTGRYYGWADPGPMQTHLNVKRLRAGRNRNSAFSEFSESMLRDDSQAPWQSPRIAFRDISRATDSRTVRIALVPPQAFLTNKAPYLLWPRGDERDLAYLLGVLASIPLDWYARRFVEVNLNFFIFNPLPVPRPPRTSSLWQRVVALAGRLAAVDDRYATWAAAVGVECGPLPAEQKQDHIHELDAVVAHLYGLSEPQLVHIFETFHEGWDYSARLGATLAHYRAWQNRV